MPSDLNSGVSSNVHDAVLRLASPATFAMAHSRGQWQLFPHLELLDRMTMELVTRQCRPRVMTAQLPVRHGKSEYLSKNLPSWFLTRWPNRRVLLASYSDDMARHWGRKSRAVLKEYGAAYGVVVSDEQSAASEWETNHGGGMATAGCGGSLTGRGADLLIIDDPLKSPEEAASETVRESRWEWLTSTALTRLEPGGVCIVGAARWHEDDLIGRLLRRAASGEGEPVLDVRLPAIAEEHDQLGRVPGEPLWPERFDIDSLIRVRDTTPERFWTALYQQRPTPAGGGFFKRQWFKLIDATDVPRELFERGTAVRYWDCAASHGKGDYTAGVLIAKHDGRTYVLNVRRGQWSPHERKRHQRNACTEDARRLRSYRTWQEEEPGSAGKDAAALFVREFAEFGAATQRATGSKETRAASWADECEAGNVYVVKADWTAAYLDEHCAFPHGANDDQVDASAGGFMKLAKRRTFAVGIGEPEKGPAQYRVEYGGITQL